MGALALILVGLAPVRAATSLPTINWSKSGVVYYNDLDIDVYTPSNLASAHQGGRIRLLALIQDVGAWNWRNGTKKHIDALRAQGFSLPPASNMFFCTNDQHRIQKGPSNNPNECIASNTKGGQLIRDLARKHTEVNPLVVVVGGPLTCVADAILLDPSVPKKLVVYAMLKVQNNQFATRGDYNGQVDPWAVAVVMKNCRIIVDAHPWQPGTNPAVGPDSATNWFPERLPAGPLCTFLTNLDFKNKLPEKPVYHDADAVYISAFNHAYVKSSRTGKVAEVDPGRGHSLAVG